MLRVFSHHSESFVESLQRIVSVSAAYKGFKYIFFHIRTCMLLSLEKLKDGVISGFVSQTGHDGKGIYPVISRIVV